ncbi:hypothetical protein EFB08_02305 [Rufibacter latericius]|uniref:Uncharacterized protein n=1 Tax=Rufibacter latericius TaxID=2487040 RepID=A0A3M9N0Q1_9BACT|nr:hypothetical protein EFB08_02305 [Rufibacter latericius]
MGLELTPAGALTFINSKTAYTPLKGCMQFLNYIDSQRSTTAKTDPPAQTQSMSIEGTPLPV